MILEEIQKKIEKSDLCALLMIDPTNLKYVTGLTLSSAALIITSSSAHLFVDERYVLMARKLEIDLQIHSGTKSEIKSAMEPVLKEIQGDIGFDGNQISYEYHKKLLQRVPSITLVSSPSFFSQLRRQKNSEEIFKIERACQICENGLMHLLSCLEPGVTEKELEQEIKLFWLTHGADNTAFPMIIAFGPNSACPHWTCSDTPLKKDTIVLIDIGVEKDGYNSDMTRIIFYGDVDDELRACFSHVEEAFHRAVKEAIPGALPYELDKSAREYLDSCGRGAFSHGLGHGVGMQVHEPPRLSPESINEDALQIGDVITIEPGLYIEGKGGVRLEDTFAIEAEGARSLCSLPAKLIEIPV